MDCREWIANFIISAAPAEVGNCWHISPEFSELRADTLRRVESDNKESRFPRGAVLAAIAEGLRVSHKPDEAIVTAAFAITLGKASDENAYGASAVRVLLSPELMLTDAFVELRDAWNRR